MLDLAFPLERVRAADYNPRKITGDLFEALKRSIGEIGFAKPVIVRADGLIVAGHQRCRAARALGIEVVPAWVLKEVSRGDETRFNQLHNGTDVDMHATPVRVPPGPVGVFEDVEPEHVAGDARAPGAGVRNDIAPLILRYGRWGCAVATASGLVLSGQQYALTCRTLLVPTRVFRVPDELEAVARAAFGRAYGEFSYEHLERKTYIQTLAQPKRLRGTEHAHSANKCSMWEEVVLPRLKTGETVLDFGCGQADYVRLLQRMGLRVFGIEFFLRRKGVDAIDAPEVHRMIDEALEHYASAGGFDVVIAASVINSVDSVQAEADVMTCCNAFAKPGGRICVSGRGRHYPERAFTSTKNAANARAHRGVEFLDADGLTAVLRAGEWFFQKYHTPEQALALGRRYIGPDAKHWLDSWTFKLAGTKTITLAPAEVEAALRREFELPWPGGRTVGRSAQAIAAYREALTNVSARANVIAP